MKELRYAERYEPRLACEDTESMDVSGKVLLLCGAAVAAVLAVIMMGGGDSTSAGENGSEVARVASVPDGNPCTVSRPFYVAPNGEPTNDGSKERPLDLATALSEKSPAKPCDTIWLRGGTYQGGFKSAVSGSDGRPIIIRQYDGERATLDSVGRQAQETGLMISGSWTWFIGFEITNSGPQRVSKEAGQWPGDLQRGTGVAARGAHIKLINLAVHDMARGFEVNEDSIGTEMYGNLIYNNGWEGAEGVAQGNGIGTRNQLGYRRIVDNIIFNQFSNGIAMFGKYLDNITVEGNVVFNNGSISRKGVTEARNILLGGAVVANTPVVKSNVTYNGQTNLGYAAGCLNGTVTDNYFAGPLVWVKCSGTVKGNSLYDPSVSGYGTLPTDYPENIYHNSRPTGTVIRIRPNQYEPGRANVVVLNWDKADEVDLDLSQARLTSGDRYEIRDAQDYFGGPVTSGTYTAGPVKLPLTRTTVAKPVGNAPSAAQHTLPDLGTFVVLKITSN